MEIIAVLSEIKFWLHQMECNVYFVFYHQQDFQFLYRFKH